MRYLYSVQVWMFIESQSFHITEKTSALRNKPPVFNTKSALRNNKTTKSRWGVNLMQRTSLPRPNLTDWTKICIYKIRAYTKKGKMIYFTSEQINTPLMSRIHMADNWRFCHKFYYYNDGKLWLLYSTKCDVNVFYVKLMLQ